MPKRLLLTGAGGSIGCHTLIHLLHNTDWEIVCTDSFRHKGWMDRITEIMADHPEYFERVKIVTHDLLAPFSEVTKKKIGNIDYIISMAALSDVEASIVNPVEFVLNNVHIVLNMLEYARETKPEVFIQISTDEVYGPTAGKDDGYKEWDSKVPSNPYAASKSCQEELAIAWWRAFGVPLIITNTMNLFGETQDPEKYTARLISKIQKGEEVTVHGSEGNIGSRYYLHARNGADAVLFILNNVKPILYEEGKVDRPERFNIVGDLEVNNLDLAKLVAKILGKELKYKLENFHAQRSGHDRRYALSGKKQKHKHWTLKYI